MPALSATARRIVRRQGDGDGDGSPSSSTTVVTIVVVAIVAFALAATLVYLLLRALRRKHADPKYVPTNYLKDRWRRWQPGSIAKGGYSDRLQDGTSAPTLHLRSARNSAAHLSGVADGNGASVDRNTSVRSVMTLPAYTRSVRDNERVLGREGERGGIDIVVEAPETVEEEETRRDEEMESLYQIREQRRREASDAQNRRDRRREARDAGDRATLAALREESQLRALDRDITGAQAMIVEHQSRSRERRVSSVSYADIGVARHDGSRVRANSNESDRPLLDSAASIGGRASLSASTHRRDRSASSVHSDDLDVYELPPFARRGSDFSILQAVAGGQRHSRSGSASRIQTPNRSRASSAAIRPSVDTADLGDARIPEPPDYEGQGFAGEEAPPYTSPVDTMTREQLQQQLLQVQRQRQQQEQQRPETERTTSSSGAPTLPEISRLPSIRIAEASPIEARPSSFMDSVLEGNRGR